jgi:hypothetical protein
MLFTFTHLFLCIQSSIELTYRNILVPTRDAYIRAFINWRLAINNEYD